MNGAPRAKESSPGAGHAGGAEETGQVTKWTLRTVVSFVKGEMRLVRVLRGVRVVLTLRGVWLS